VKLEDAGNSKLDEIRNSIRNLKAELDTIESLFENLEDVIKGD
jgi:predicted component of type VI protein secretion system